MELENSHFSLTFSFLTRLTRFYYSKTRVLVLAILQNFRCCFLFFTLFLVYVWFVLKPLLLYLLLHPCLQPLTNNFLLNITNNFVFNGLVKKNSRFTFYPTPNFLCCFLFFTLLLSSLFGLFSHHYPSNLLLNPPSNY